MNFLLIIFTLIASRVTAQGNSTEDPPILESLDTDANSFVNVNPVNLEASDVPKGRNEKLWRSKCRVERRAEHTLKDDCATLNGPFLECINYTRWDTVVHCSEVDVNDVWSFIPNNTYFLSFSGTPTTILSKSVLSHLSPLKHLRFYHGNLTMMSSTFLKGLSSLESLILAYNTFFRLHENMFQYTPNIEEIDLRYNFIRSVESVAKSVATLKNLKTLNLSNNVIIEILDDKTFSTMNDSPLETLDFSFCQLRNISTKTFLPLSKLKKMWLGHNPFPLNALFNITNGLRGSEIRYLDLSFLPNVKGEFPIDGLIPLSETPLEELDLSHNYYTTLPVDCMPEIATLKIFHLKSCGIMYIELGAFANLVTLEELDLSYNRLTSLNGIPKDLPNLIKLNLSYNNNREYSRVSFSLKDLGNFQRLKVLRLQDCDVAEAISYDMFQNLTSLEYLNMESTRTTAIEDFAFADLGNLKSLLIGHNIISTLTNDTFYGLSQLEQLHMPNNDVVLALDKYPFQHLENVYYINLSRNKISNLPKDVFSSCPKLEILDMEANHIVPWNYTVFPKNNTFRILILPKNQISYVTDIMMEQFQNLEKLNLERNPLDCSLCGMKIFQHWALNYSQMIKFLEDPFLYKCHDSGQGFTNAEIIDDHCYLTSPDPFYNITIPLSVLAGLLILVSIIAYNARWYLRYFAFRIRIKVRNYRESVCEKNYEYDAFVSYSHTDVEWVSQQLVPSLENNDTKFKLCLHDRDFQAGIPITDNILGSIEKSRKTVMVLTEDYVQSNWCMFEFHMAQHALFEDTRDALILIHLNKIPKEKMSKHLRYLMRTRTYILWTDSSVGQKLFWEKLIDSIRTSRQRQKLKEIL